MLVVEQMKRGEECAPEHSAHLSDPGSAVQVWASADVQCPDVLLSCENLAATESSISIISPPQACPHTDTHKDHSRQMTVTQRQHRWMTTHHLYHRWSKGFWEKR
ncbi:hypothetical protein WMY93_012723 [Mugilogobius chulae]|uniref:Uncharacterized protein n=1 Tax=Mugilogobius chulae TaxID=88201 RepID=A0AAW0P719_9GOBI